MTSKVKPIPDGLQGAVPYLCCRDAAGAIEFYKKAFGATEVMRFADPSGKIGHAELKIGEALIMLADEFPEHHHHSPETLGGSAVTIHLYTEDVDAFAERAVAAGARVLIPIENQFYGDRGGRLIDPFGHMWAVATHIEDVSDEEMQRRAAALDGQ